MFYLKDMGIVFGWILVGILSALVIAGTAYILPGVSLRNFGTALLVALVLGLINLFIRPFLVILTLPITYITLGLFLFVINAFLILLTSAIVPSFKVNGFWTALLFSIIISLIRVLLGAIFLV